MLRECGDNREDVELVARARGREPRALETFLRRLACIPVILRVRNRRLGNPLDEALLEDLAQEVLLAIWNKLEDFDGASTLEAWVYQFCLHKHLAQVRNRGRRARIETVESALVDGAAQPLAQRDVDDERLRLSLAELDDPRGRIVRLKHFEDLTFEEIGARLSMSPNTAKTHYYRALASLRDALARGATGRTP